MSKADNECFEQLKTKVRMELAVIYLRARIRYDSYKMKYEQLKTRIKATFLR